MSVLRRSLLALAIVGMIAAAPAAGVAQRTTADSVCAGCPRPQPVLAVLTVFGINVFMNRFNSWVLNVHDPVEGYWARVSPQTWSNNIRAGWTWDTDNFTINMFGHPYQGGAYFRAGRTNGLTFWESAPLTFLGSAQWEFFAETTKPSLNDFYNTSFGGMVVGEAVHRLVLLIRDNESRGAGRVLRELVAFPFDVTGGIRRLAMGDFTRVFPNPGERGPPLLALQVQGGIRQARDTGVSGTRLRTGTLVGDLTYGDALAMPYGRPFDAFHARVLISPGTNPLGELRIAGRLYAHEITNPSASVRALFMVRQKFEYTRNPAYKVGGQSFEAGVVAGRAFGNVRVQVDGYAEAIMMGAVDAPGAGAPGTPRTYDFGPGVGSDVGVSIHLRHFPVFAARYQWSMLHSVSGAPADHFTQLPSVEAALPVTRTLGLGASVDSYGRRTTYANGAGETGSYRDFRVYLVWRSRPRPTTPQPQ